MARGSSPTGYEALEFCWTCGKSRMSVMLFDVFSRELLKATRICAARQMRRRKFVRTNRTALQRAVPSAASDSIAPHMNPEALQACRAGGPPMCRTGRPTIFRIRKSPLRIRPTSRSISSQASCFRPRSDCARIMLTPGGYRSRRQISSTYGHLFTVKWSWRNSARYCCGAKKPLSVCGPSPDSR